MVFVSSRKKQGWEFFYKSKKSRCTTMISQININESNNLNTSNSDNIIGTSNLPHSNIQNNIVARSLEEGRISAPTSP